MHIFAAKILTEEIMNEEKWKAVFFGGFAFIEF
jgi:hypothetical protein